MLHSLIRHLIHQPFAYNLGHFFNKSRKNKFRSGAIEPKTKKPALFHMTRQGQTREYNKCLFFDKLDEQTDFLLRY